jgi:N-acetylglucosaminyl-diphospho-decaprenol L-rhamnosyltransferase
MSSQSALAGIVVHYRTPTALASCLESLDSQTLQVDEVVVIDNSGVHGTAPKQPDNDRCRILQAGSNLGFGRACNVGAGSTRGDYLLFLNADVTLTNKACENLCLGLQSDPDAAVVGPRIYDAAGEIELSARSFPSWWTGLAGRSSAATRLMRRAGGAPRGVATALNERRSRVDWVSGACMLVRRAAFDEVGGFDEDYWMYWEDADFCRRLAYTGWHTLFEPAATAYHATGSSGRSARTIEAFHTSAALYYERHVARNALEARTARWFLDIRMRLRLHRQAARSAAED